MLKRPRLAKCGDAREVVKGNKTQTLIDHMLSDQNLNEINLISVSFDFFVNWDVYSINLEIWIKRILDIPLPNINDISKSDLVSQIKVLDGIPFVWSLLILNQKYNMQIKYKLYEDKSEELFNVDKANKENVLLELELDYLGNSKLKHQNIEDLSTQIRSLSGGPMKIGEKGLTYSTSTLECFFSKTNSPWPGDIDSLIMSLKHKRPLLMIELKKHTLKDSPMEDHTYENYYPSKDYKKYQRLALLAEYFDIPLIIIYYSIHQQDYILVDIFAIERPHKKVTIRLKRRLKEKIPLNPQETERLFKEILAT